MSDDLDFMPAARPAGQDKRGAAETTPPTPSTALARVSPTATTTSAGPSSSATATTTGSAGTTSATTPAEPPGGRADLPTWNRSRRKRQATVDAEQQDDAFQRGVRTASRSFIDTPKLVIGGIVILLATIAAGVALHNRNVTADAEATRTLEVATAAIVRGQVVPAETLAQVGEEVVGRVRSPIFTTQEERDAAIEEALAAARSSGRPKVEQDATLVVATRAVRNGDFEAAIVEYDAFLADVDDDHPLRFLALEGKGTALEANGQLDEALAVFASIAPHPTDFYRHMALYHQGRVLEALERTDEALAIYEQYFTEFPITREQMATPMVRARVEKLDPEFAAQLTAPPAPVIESQ